MQINDKLLIIQSGAMGDIFVVAPIAKHYNSKEYTVYWPLRKKFSNLVANYFPYVHAMIIEEMGFHELHDDWLRSDTMNLHAFSSQNHYSMVIDTSDRGHSPMQNPNETFEQYKYRVAGVPFAYKNHLDWERNETKENDLKAIIESNYDIDLKRDHYIVAHVDSSHGDRAEIPEGEYRKCIYITEIKGFEIPDWYPIISGAKAIYAVESAVHQFIDGTIHRIKYETGNKMEFYLLSRSSLAPGERYTHSKYWSKKYMK